MYVIMYNKNLGFEYFMLHHFCPHTRESGSGTPRTRCFTDGLSKVLHDLTGFYMIKQHLVLELVK